MKRLIFILFFLLTFISFAQEKKCSEFKIGKYEYSNPKYSEWKIIRTDSTQIEISKKTGVKITSSIEWKSDCEFTLTCDKIQNSNLKDAVGKTVNVKIVETLPNSYMCISQSQDFNFNLELEVLKID